MNTTTTSHSPIRLNPARPSVKLPRVDHPVVNQALRGCRIDSHPAKVDDHGPMENHTILFPDDLELALRAMAGDAKSVEAFYERYREPLMAAMLKRAGGSHAQLAVDAVENFLAECVSSRMVGPASKKRERPARLESYAGRAPLLAWLRSGCTRILLDMIRAFNVRRADSLDDLAQPPTGSDGRADLPQSSDADHVGNVMQASVEKALMEADVEGVVIMRLAALHNVPLNAIAKAWDLHPCNITKRMQKALLDVRSAALDEASRIDPALNLTWGDFEVYGEAIWDILRDDTPSPSATA